MRRRTLAIVKPDGVERGLIGEIIKRLEEENMAIVAMKMIHMSKAQAKGFYKVHEGKPFYESVTDFMSSGPCVVMVLQGEDVIARYRETMGATNPREAAAGTIRRLFATDIERNVVHGSDSEENAELEVNYFFNALELVAS
jgi:nucleoside-diphosphate kinase